jgi:hypothetical protein
MNGKLVLDSKNTNYSYGNLQRILRTGLKNIGFKKINKMSQILVLGVAGGSVIKTLVDEIQNLQIIIDDAFEFVLKTNNKYDLIVIDVFQDTKMPNFLFETFFIERICVLLNPNGFILFNTMILNEKQKQINLDYIKNFDVNKYNSRKPHLIDETNELILIESKF